MPPEDSSPAQDTTPVVEPDYSSPNDLDFDMSDEQEQKYVEQVLAGGAEPQIDTPETPEKPIVPEKDKVPETPIVPEKPTETPIVPEIPIIPEVTTPSEPKTDDLFIEVDKIVIDDLGEETTEKVTLTYDPLHPENFIPDDFKAKNDKQLAQILEAKGEMAKLYTGRKDEIDTKLAKVAKTEQIASEQKAQLDSWDAEIADLISIGSIPEPKLKEGETGYLEDPSVKLTEAVFQYMIKANAERNEAGQQPIRSFGTAFALYQKDAEVVAEKAKKEKDNADAKAKGALIGGSSASSTGGDSKPMYVAGSARNIWDVKV